MSIGKTYLETSIMRVLYYKQLGDQTFEQLAEKDLFFHPSEESNSIAIIIQHMHGNMLSRWTNFLTEDGEKSWRNRDAEFDNNITNREGLLRKWNEGWDIFITTLRSLNEGDLLKEISIRSEKMTVIDAINRQLAHYPYHVGQIVLIGKMIRDKAWHNLSVPKGGSDEFNKRMKHE